MEITALLRGLVHDSVSLLGQVIERELGPTAYRRIEGIRQKMASLREASNESSVRRLQDLYTQLEKLSRSERRDIARGFTLMLELMNACENSYRSHRLGQRAPLNTSHQENLPEAIIYVLTAHPTEARSPQNIAVFHRIQTLLIAILDRQAAQDQGGLLPAEANDLRHLLEVAWRTAIIRDRAPQVTDEAEHIYSLLLRDDVLLNLVSLREQRIPFYVRTWVGGDKDGHPGVDEKVLTQSLTLSRAALLRILLSLLQEVRSTVDLFPSKDWQARLRRLEKNARALRILRKGDGAKVQTLAADLHQLRRLFSEKMGAIPPALRRCGQILHVFPGLVVPLELRESSDVLMSKPPRGQTLAIDRMLKAIALFSEGGDPRWYARGFIISMTESVEHIRSAAQRQLKLWKAPRLPVIPLFEEASSLKESPQIIRAFVKDPLLGPAAKKYWDGKVEMMVGYSDSAKEAGVWPSRLAIAKALPELEEVCHQAGLRAIFFHGSGGSVDRGGGSIEDQTAWWPASALQHYKVTIQGEMVDRSMATPLIARRQIEKIVESAQRGLSRPARQILDPALQNWADSISAAYRKEVHSDDFLKMVEAATPYSFLNVLKLGSRPSKRTAQLTVSGLRAIPWVLCWTQTRVLFPTWWGVGSAWEQATPQLRKDLQKALRHQPVLTSYVKALGFTLAKVELSVWRIYLEKSGLPADQVAAMTKKFDDEFQKTLRCFQELTGQTDLLWFRPWLGESITLRSSMIHPLNLLQILAQRTQDIPLLRQTVTGISSGMLTTG